MRLKWKLVLVHLQIVPILMQDRSTVCAERTIGSEIILDAPNRTPKVTWVFRNLVSVHFEVALVSVQDRCIVCAKHTIGSEIVSDAPDGNPW